MHRSLDEFKIQSDPTMCFTRPRYQVSVYRTIGPLVILSNRNKAFILDGLMEWKPIPKTFVEHQYSHLKT